MATLTLFFSYTKAQDPVVSQFYSAPLYLNPAMAGAEGCHRISGNYRNQWASIPGTFSFFNFSYDHYVDAISGGIGFIVNNLSEGNGAYSTTNVGAMYAYNMRLGKNISLRAAVQANIVNRHIDFSRLKFGDQFDEVTGFMLGSVTNEPIPVRPTSKLYPDFSTGLILSAYDWYGGVAINHLATKDQSFMDGDATNLPMKITVHVGGVIYTVPKRDLHRYTNPITLSPNVIWQQQGFTNQLHWGLYANIYPIVVGAWLRNNFYFKNIPEIKKDFAESLTLLIGFQHKSLRIGYSYDMSLSKLQSISGGSHEVSFMYQFPCSERVVQTRYSPIPCPKF